MNQQTAAAIAKLMLDVTAQLDASVKLVMNESDVVEFEAYKSCIGKILGQIYCDVLSPTFRQHPQLMPDELRGPGAPKNET